jgi:lipoate---protein ligase
VESVNMRVIDYTFTSPEENIAFDDRLLDEGCETLRFWESATHFVVLGRSGNLHDDLDVTACQASGVPVVRRSSGGGTVLQGPGCLNYALVLSLESRPGLQNVANSYVETLGRVADAINVASLEVRGSDILLGGRKVSGNAQRRTRGWLLLHGTILYALDISAIERLLLEPKRRPAHREDRTHREFLTTINLYPRQFKQRMRHAFTGE